MSIIEEIIDGLQAYPDAKFESDDMNISVFPLFDDGFTVSFSASKDTYTIGFNGWHEEFQDKEEALNCFAFGLSSECRLKEIRRGSFAYKWTVESKENGRWVEDSTTGLLLFPFWKKKEERYLQNTLIREKRSSA